VLPAKACTAYEHRFKLSKIYKVRIFFMVIWIDVFLILEHVKISLLKLNFPLEFRVPGVRVK